MGSFVQDQNTARLTWYAPQRLASFLNALQTNLKRIPSTNTHTHTHRRARAHTHTHTHTHTPGPSVRLSTPCSVQDGFSPRPERRSDGAQEKRSGTGHGLTCAGGDKWTPTKRTWPVNTKGIPFWLVGEFTTHFRTYGSGWIGMFTGMTFGF